MPFRYFLVVGFGFLFDFLTYAIIVASGQSVYLANVVGFCVGASINVVLIRRFVFRNSRYSLPVDIQLTMASNGFMLFFGMLLLLVLVEYFGVDSYLAKLVANAVTFVLNYGVRVFFFRK
jgi:putative flippase GtrA